MKRLNRSRCLILAFFLLVTVLSGCDSKNSESSSANNGKGDVSIEIDVKSLTEYANATKPRKGIDLTITEISLDLSNQYGASVQEIIPVVDNTATIVIDNLEAGYWTVNADVLGVNGPLFQGTADVNIKSGMTVGCTMLFDPVDNVLGLGSVSVTVGINPIPGYKRMPPLAINDILTNDAQQEIIMFPSPNTMDENYVAIFDSNLNRINDVLIPFTPTAACMSYNTPEVYLGNEFGELALFDSQNGYIGPVGASMDISSIKAISNENLLVVSEQPGYANAEIHNTFTGSIVSHPLFYDYDNNTAAPFAFSEENLTLYQMTNMMMPDLQLESVRYNNATQEFYNSRPSTFMGSYPYVPPLVCIKNGQRLLTGNGDMFISSPDDTPGSQDMQFTGNIGFTFTDIATDESVTDQFLNDIAHHLYLLTDTPIKTLTIIDDTNYSVVASIDLPDNPKKVLVTYEKVYVFVEYEGVTFGKVWNRIELLSQ